MTLAWQPYREPFRTTLLRTGAIALVISIVLAQRWHDFSKLPLLFFLMLWPSLGGHFVELWFLNWLRPRIPHSRDVQVGVRLTIWFVGGILLMVGMNVTAIALLGLKPMRWQMWWMAGFGFIAIELIAHLFLQWRVRRSFYNGRG